VESALTVRLTLVLAALLTVFAVVGITVEDAWSVPAVVFVVVAVGFFVLRGYLRHRQVGVRLGQRLRRDR
jgi:hypothetical protein